MLKRDEPEHGRRLAGLLAVGLVTLAAGYATWAMQPPTPAGPKPPLFIVLRPPTTV
jgi:hypothetical protein